MSREELLATLEQDGCAVVADAVSDAAIDGLIRALETTSGAAPLARDGSVFALRNLLGIPQVQSLAASDELRRLVEPVLGPGAFAVRGLLFDKTPQANWKVPWHQDLTVAVRERRETPGWGPWSLKAGIPHVQPPVPVLERMVAVRLHLDRCGPDDGALRVLPGSHRHGRLSPEQIREWRDRVAPVPLPVPRGGVLLMRPLLLHASSAAAVPAHRRVIHLEFAAEPLPDGLEWHECAPCSGTDPASMRELAS